MKKITFTLIACLIMSGSLFAQIKPEAGSMGLGFRLTGLSFVSFNPWASTGLSGQELPDDLSIFGGSTVTVDNIVPQEMLFGRYYVASDLAVRVGLGINSLNRKSMSVDSIGQNLITEESQVSAFSFGLGIGVEKHFASAATRLDPYAGAQINFGSIGSVMREATTTIDTDPVDIVEIQSEMAGGSSIGVDLLAGFNYFFSDNFAIGAEYSWGFGSVSLGGDYSEQVTVTSGGNPPVTSETLGTQKASVSGFGVGSTAGVNVSVFW